MPDFPIVDAHVHLYDPEVISYPWMASVPILDEAHLPARYFDATGNVEVDALVFVEVNAGGDVNANGQAWLDEARFVSQLAGTEPRIRAIVSSMPLHSTDSLESGMRELATLPLVRGVRTLIELHEDQPGWALHDGFVDNVRALAAHDFSFDLCLRHSQLADTIALVRRCPEVRFVLDHIAKPGIREGLRSPWQQQLATLARLPNVWCKLSGVVTEADHQHWSASDVAPYVAHAIACFGYDRLLYGGDWPVSRLACEYPRWVEVLDGIVASASATDKRKLYRDNANAFYCLGLA